MHKSSAGPKAATGCESCRVRHVRCEGAGTRCGRCAAHGSDCIRESNFRFRFETQDPTKYIKPGRIPKYAFPAKQTWPSITQELRFINTNKHLERHYSINSGCRTSNSIVSVVPLIKCNRSSKPRHHTGLESGTKQAEKPWPSVDSVQHLDFPASLVYESEYHSSGHDCDSNTANGSPGSLLSRRTGTENEERIRQPSHRHSTRIAQHHRTSIDPSTAVTDELGLLSPSSTSQCRTFPLRTRTEAYLLRHFIEKLSPWFDLTNNESKFCRGVCSRFSSSSLLRKAVYALASRHLACLKQLEPVEADEYQHDCLSSLIPMLSRASANDDEVLLAAAVMLRVTEELQVPTLGNDFNPHFQGTKILVRSLETAPDLSSLGRAAFWTGVRQEIGVSLLTHQQIDISLNFSFFDRSFLPADEGTWANRIIVHLVDVVNYCFDNGPGILDTYMGLVQYSEEWSRTKPSLLDPIYESKSHTHGDQFPEIMYANDCAVIAAQYYSIACLLLASFRPRTPRIGSSRLLAAKMLTDEIKLTVRQMCGVALSNPNTMPALLTASLGISLCGDHFVEAEERQALLDVLIKTEAETAWPTKGIQDALILAWQEGN